ncbi:hypothetical protein [Pelagicoccus sp. SDUM812003]|uniref:hypothetical protein n=1 Tax=Pelagicoccus sp. SDUM812003 TaxID=3041267 RepID=UPI00280FB74C|nr:hypothetical protein [Pelagicoccus sp. SDUM812003]MDQ8202866.1 hypothetical protein [Pelagicoccus sp. SDUM812003]
MHKILRIPTVCLFTASLGAFAFAQEDAAEVQEAPAEAEAVEESDPSVGTKAYDATTVREMFDKLKQENQRLAEEEAPHLNSDHLEVIELAPINVDPYEVRNLDLLIDRLDPQPRRRLERLAAIDPEAANELRVSIRSEERFFAGENDAIDNAGGRTANVDFRKVGSTLADAVKKAKESMRKKQVTDDQATLPTEAE